MTHTTQDDAELREAFTKLMTDIKVLAYYADMDEDILANQAEMHLKSLAKLFEASQQQLLTELLGHTKGNAVGYPCVPVSAIEARLKQCNDGGEE